MKRKCSDGQLVRKDFEDHIEKLKVELSSQEAELNELRVVGEEQNHSKQCDIEIDGLTQQVKELKLQVSKLQANNDELCHINQQWALDYESLTQRVTPNTTGLYSTSSIQSIRRSASPINCMECHSLRNQLEDALREVRSLNFKIERMQSKMDHKDLEIEHLESENKAIQMQLQEVGDLHSAVKAREDLSTMQHQMTVLKKQYQDAVCQRLQLNKQVEKLRQAFLLIFPFVNQTSRSEYSRERGYASYPTRRSCRADQQYYSDPGPPTPPGLIARGDHHGSLVEKDDDPPLQIVRRSEEQVTGFPPVNRQWVGVYPRMEGLVPGTNLATSSAPHTWHGSINDPHITVRPSSSFGNGRIEEHNGVISKTLVADRTDGVTTSHNGATNVRNDHPINGANMFEVAKKLEASQLAGRGRYNDSKLLRPSTLYSSPSPSTWNKSGSSHTTLLEELKCPNCSRAFNCDIFVFDDWFDHVKFCGT